MLEITNRTHTLVILKETADYALCEITCDDSTTPPPHRFFVVMIDRSKGQVYSVLPSDVPADGGLWVGRITPSGVAYVANPRTKSAALRHFRKLTQARNELDELFQD